MSRRHRGLAEGQQTPAEPHQDSGYVVGFSPAAGQSQHLRSASDVDSINLKRGRMTLESSSTVSCRCLHRWQWILQAAAAPPRPIYVSRSRKDASPGADFLSPVLLQLTVLRHHWRSHEPVAVCPECGCTFGVGRSTLRPHHTSATGAAEAFGSTSGGFQDGHLRLPVTVRHRCSLPGYWLPVGLRQRSSSAAFCHIKDARCETNIQLLWRLKTVAGLKLWNSFPAELRVTSWRNSFQRFKRLLDIFVRVLRSRHNIVTRSNC